MKTLLVDGYNVIFGSQLRVLPLERARESLVIFSRVWHPHRVMVVFDGSMDVPFPALPRGAVFARETTADEWILTFIREHPDTPCVVVTADRPLASKARALGAQILSPQEFLRGPGRLRRRARRFRGYAGTGRRDDFPLPPNERKRLKDELLQEWFEQGEVNDGG